MTYEEVKAIRENSTAADCDNRELAVMIDYAIEIQIAKKPFLRKKHNLWDEFLICPTCCEELTDGDGEPLWKETELNYCPQCGQKIDWSE